MKKIILSLFLSLFISMVFANTPDFTTTPNYASYFSNKVGCFILYSVNQDKIVSEYNPTRCAQRITPASTFKIPLSLMAFDQKLITQQTVFKWDGKVRWFPAWNHDQTPKSWFENSAVWVSQALTPKLGLEKIKGYLQKYNYGNQDFSGNPGKNDALTHAWLSSSLKISANEQLTFLKALVADKLAVTHDAMKNTKQNMYVDTTKGGWKLYGKTGSGASQQNSNEKNELQDGWFVGFLEKEGQRYIFVLNFSDQQKPDALEGAGIRAKAMVKMILTNMGF